MNFIKDAFTKNEYVTYNGRFVARFKYNKRERAPFVTFLAKNFTTDEYFDRLSAGETPLAILLSKGYKTRRMLELEKFRKRNSYIDNIGELKLIS